ncbi:squalene/phytoene synthase family protein [Halorhabdus sp. CBA1104]|uniref:phytoene/squalene synthase family protein n=1 Tax=unclassified Halorhabdus TaxID=2621901 RepID=UPI0012B31202|nr:MULTISPECIES: phytoene/squalene synthase family protein [unclassified Halorhabdus]QGN06428.1 squalene/phytoene synthase family protein [Halorhabdus sp. CBA1104]
MVVASSPEPDLSWCHDALQGVSRTFALTVDVLAEPMSSQICVGYLLCRVADTVEDADHIPPARQASLLRTYGAALDPASDETILAFRDAVDKWLPAPADRGPDWTVVARSPTIQATFATQPASVKRAVVPPVREMVDGMATFVQRYEASGGLRLVDRAELEEYCYYAAGTVGKLITNLLTRDGIEQTPARTLDETAIDFGLLLQLVNVAKDVYDDYTTENNVYLPAEWLAAAGIEQETMLEATNRKAAAQVVERTAAHASTFLDDAADYIDAMPLTHGNTIAAWSVPYLLSVGTLRELRDRPEDALTDGGVKISRQEVVAIVDAATEAGRDSIPDLRRTIAETPYHLAVD